MANISAAARAVLDDVSAPFQLTDRQLVDITNSLVGEFNAGLSQTGRPVVMGLTDVTRVSSGKESGTFITLDIIWTTLRVCEVTLDGNNKSSRREKIFHMTNDVTDGTSAGFCDFIASSIDEFIKENKIQLTNRTPVGFCFPYPVDRESLGKAKVVVWRKGINLQDGPGMNLQDLLQAAFDRKGLNLKSSAIINDTVAVLLSESYGRPQGTCRVAAIFGIGANGAYFEDTAKITKSNKSNSTQMLINTELGSFSNKDVLPRTVIDQGMDAETRRPGYYGFEKLVSWVTLGELVRRILVTLEKAAPQDILTGVASGIQNPGCFNSMSLPLINQANTPADVSKILADNGIPLQVSNDKDFEVVRSVSRLVSDRVFKLCACAISALIVQAGFTTRDRTGSIAVGLRGEVVSFFPDFQEKVRSALNTILGDAVEKRVTFLVVEDADAIGAALGVYELEGRSK